MRYVDLPLLSSLPVPVIGVGAMPLSHRRPPQDQPMQLDDAIAILHHAFGLGMTLVDTADIYTPEGSAMGHNETLVGEAVRSWPGGRDSITVVTKFGITRTPGPDGDDWDRDGSADYLHRAAEAAAKRLGFVPDATLLHRVNRTQQSFEQTMKAVVSVRDAGLARRVGIGNVHVDECQIAWDVSEGAVAAVENERSPRYRDDSEVLAWCGERGVAYLAWSPLGGGDDAARLGQLHPEFAAVASELSESGGREVSAQEVTLAWLTSGGQHVVPIPAFTRTSTADSAAAAAEIVLNSEQIARLDASPVGDGSLFPD